MPNPRPDNTSMRTLKAAFPPGTNNLGYLALINDPASSLTSTSTPADWLDNYEVSLVGFRYSFSTPAAGSYTMNTGTTPRQAEFTVTLTIDRTGSGPGSDFTFTDILLLIGDDAPFYGSSAATEIIGHWRGSFAAPADVSTPFPLPVFIRSGNP